MSKELTHWKKLQNPNYLGAYALQPDEEPVLTISKAGAEMVTGSDGKSEECSVIHFKEQGYKPMILNVTNSKTIEKVTGTPYIEEWIGKRIQLFVAEIRAFGEDMEALRIRPQAPTSKKPIFDQAHPNWGKGLEAVRKGETTISDVEGKYILTPESREALLKAVPNA